MSFRVDRARELFVIGRLRGLSQCRTKQIRLLSPCVCSLRSCVLICCRTEKTEKKGPGDGPPGPLTALRGHSTVVGAQRYAPNFSSVTKPSFSDEFDLAGRRPDRRHARYWPARQVVRRAALNFPIPPLSAGRILWLRVRELLSLGSDIPWFEVMAELPFALRHLGNITTQHYVPKRSRDLAFIV